MKIDASRLKEGRAENFQEVLTVEDLDLGINGVKYKGNIIISAEVKKEKDILFTKTHFGATAEYSCSRCLKKYAKIIEKDFNAEYPLGKTEQNIDITEDMREEVILDCPVKFLCKPDCRGLCPKCGKDLNDGKCSC